MLFIDARHIYRQIDRAHRDFLPEQIEFLANIVRLYRGEEPETVDGQRRAAWTSASPTARTRRAGLCKVATLAEIEAQGWSLNPGRYVGVAARAADDVRLRRAAGGAERGAGAAQRRGARAGGADRARTWLSILDRVA